MKTDPSKLREVGAFEAKNTLGTLLDRVEHGEEIVITRHGKPVARLVPTTRGNDKDRARAAFERIRERTRLLHEQNRDKDKEPLDWPTLKKWRDEGRP
jgi:prevent-host-death family protein